VRNSWSCRARGRCDRRSRVHRMCQTIVHRGPDDEGIYARGPVGLGMRRLSIIDLAGGKQPIHNEDGSVWVVFNGEIYNFPELRGELQGRGHQFYTHSDTEVIVHLYEEMGADCVKKLRGMFAIALYDEKRNRCCWLVTGWAKTAALRSAPGKAAVRIRDQDDSRAASGTG
jgi:asparagine synthase (glutamine-hydrolysing)